MMTLANMQIFIAGSVLTVLWILESIIPFLGKRPLRVRHAMRNIAIGIFNLIILALLFAPLFVGLTSWSETHSFGLLRFLDLPVPALILAAILLQDGWMYAWHRANHRVPFLWRFHRVHHSDPEMDASTAVRFHPGEIIISAVLRLGIIVVLGLSLQLVLLYDVMLMPVILFHHSNVKFPERWDRFYRALLASPAMHRIHHSPERIETDSNYASIFSFWDRLARSFRLRDAAGDTRYGLNEFDSMNTEKISVLALMPFYQPVGPHQKQASSFNARPA